MVVAQRPQQRHRQTTPLPCSSYMSLFKLFNRDTQFFDLLENGASEALNGAVCLRKLLDALGSSATETLLGDLAQSRRKHKGIANATTQGIIAVFVTPIDREDIEELSGN